MKNLLVLVHFDYFIYIEKLLFYHYRTDGSESPILPDTETDGHSDKPRVKYGELVILG